MKRNLKKLAGLAVAGVCAASLCACGGGGNAPADAAGSAAAEQEAASAPAEAAGDDVIEKGVLKVGMECNYAPYNWTQADDSNGAVPIKDSSDYAFGYDVMMAKYLADELGYKVEVNKIEWDALPVALQSGKIDCVIAGQSITSERLETVDFTTPYYYASIVALVKADGPYADAKGMSELKGCKATSQLNTVWYDVCLDQIPDVEKLTAMKSATEMTIALQSDRCNVVVTDMPTAMAAVESDPGLKMLDFTGNEDNFKVSEEEINIGISVKKGNSALLEKLNAGLAKLSEEDFNKWMEDAISKQPLTQE